MKSMTAFARESLEIGGVGYFLEIRTVNGRFRDFSIRLPLALRDLEDPIREVASKKISRGRVQLSLVSVQPETQSQDIQVNLELARRYLDGFQLLKKELGIPGEPDVSVFARLRDILVSRVPETDTDWVWKQLEPVVHGALESINRMRFREGDHLGKDMEQRLDALVNLLDQIESRSDRVVRTYADKMADRIRDLVGGVEIDTDRILQEAAMMADKTDITEELVRARSHVQQFRSFMVREEPVGRKLEFLIQELQREINTIGSKAQDSTIAHWVVEAKSEIEKIREQVQNVE